MRLFRWAIRATILLDRNKTFWYTMRLKMLSVFEEEFEFMYVAVEDET